jgi:hypothetical protein
MKDIIVGWECHETVAMGIHNPTSIGKIGKGTATQEEFNALYKAIIEDMNSLYQDDQQEIKDIGNANIIYVPGHYWKISKFNPRNQHE